MITLCTVPIVAVGRRKCVPGPRQMVNMLDSVPMKTLRGGDFGDDVLWKTLSVLSGNGTTRIFNWRSRIWYSGAAVRDKVKRGFLRVSGKGDSMIRLSGFAGLFSFRHLER